MKSLVLLSAVYLAIGFTGMKARAENFPFKSYERRVAADTDVAGATRDLKARIPIGSPVSEYEHLFKELGGRCRIITDTKRYPNTTFCEYSHGSSLVAAEWKCVIEFDPTTMTSTNIKLGFGLTGP
jgi:hypothetical protein